MVHSSPPPPPDCPKGLLLPHASGPKRSMFKDMLSLETHLVTLDQSYSLSPTLQGYCEHELMVQGEPIYMIFSFLEEGWDKYGTYATKRWSPCLWRVWRSYVS